MKIYIESNKVSNDTVMIRLQKGTYSRDFLWGVILHYFPWSSCQILKIAGCVGLRNFCCDLWQLPYVVIEHTLTNTKFSNTWWWNCGSSNYGKTCNIYTIWYIECNSIFNEIGMRKYPWKCFQWYCLPERHIDLNEGQISITSSFYRWCTYLASLYKKCSYILGVFRPQ